MLVFVGFLEILTKLKHCLKRFQVFRFSQQHCVSRLVHSELHPIAFPLNKEEGQNCVNSADLCFNSLGKFYSLLVYKSNIFNHAVPLLLEKILRMPLNTNDVPYTRQCELMLEVQRKMRYRSIARKRTLLTDILLCQKQQMSLSIHLQFDTLYCWVFPQFYPNIYRFYDI